MSDNQPMQGCGCRVDHSTDDARPEGALAVPASPPGTPEGSVLTDALEVVAMYHRWLEKVEQHRVCSCGARTYMGLDHTAGENVGGCSGCDALARLEEALTQVAGLSADVTRLEGEKDELRAAWRSNVDDLTATYSEIVRAAEVRVKELEQTVEAQSAKGADVRGQADA